MSLSLGVELLDVFDKDHGPNLWNADSLEVFGAHFEKSGYVGDMLCEFCDDGDLVFSDAGMVLNEVYSRFSRNFDIDFGFDRLFFAAFPVFLNCSH